MMEQNNKEPKERMLGALVPDDIYWKFKGVASNRKESLKEAVFNAALLYINAIETKED